MMRLVLDTNVWLDWLVFEDQTVIPLRMALHDGRIRIAINAPCLEELGRVLGYPEFQLDASRQDRLLAEVHSCAIRVESIRPAPLPRCTDPDDQKFLELARDSHAGWLITRDNALLKLSAKKLHAAGFRIDTPEQWAIAFESVTPR